VDFIRISSGGIVEVCDTNLSDFEFNIKLNSMEMFGEILRKDFYFYFFAFLFNPLFGGHEHKGNE
jgi:hypothetical protein